MENKPHITDDYVLSKETLTSHEAADYLGISWWNLTDGLKTGTYRFGTAKANKSGKYTYTIYARQAYNFKHGTYDVDQQQYANKVFSGGTNTNVYIGGTEAGSVSVGNTKIYG